MLTAGAPLKVVPLNRIPAAPLWLNELLEIEVPSSSARLLLLMKMPRLLAVKVFPVILAPGDALPTVRPIVALVKVLLWMVQFFEVAVYDSDERTKTLLETGPCSTPTRRPCCRAGRS
jgi:hypothetical protein